MKTTFTRSVGWLLATVIMAGILFLFGSGVKGELALASQPNPGVIPIDAELFGKSYGEWGAEWWIWGTEKPFATNQIADPTGEFCTLGQSGQVWFLAGTFGGTVTRDCTVPLGKFLFFPIANGLSFAPEFGNTEEEIRQDVALDLANIIPSAVYVDGSPLQDLSSYRVASPAFVLPIPEGGLLSELGLDPGDREPAVSDGWWLMLAPLRKGEHTIHIEAGGTDRQGEPFELNVTYNLVVE